MKEFDPTARMDVISLDDFLAGRWDKIRPLNSPEGQKIVGENPEVVAHGDYDEFGVEEPSWKDVEEYNAMREARSREIDAEIERLHVSDVNAGMLDVTPEEWQTFQEMSPHLYAERHPNSARFHELLEEAGAMHDRKQADYGRGDDPFANVRASEEWGIDGWVGALVRLSDKVKRLQSLSQKGHLVNESALDSLMDIAVYALIAYVLYEQQYGQAAA